MKKRILFFIICFSLILTACSKDNFLKNTQWDCGIYILNFKSSSGEIIWNHGISDDITYKIKTKEDEIKIYNDAFQEYAATETKKEFNDFNGIPFVLIIQYPEDDIAIQYYGKYSENKLILSEVISETDWDEIYEFERVSE